jgi:hypothetical protein
MPSACGYAFFMRVFSCWCTAFGAGMLAIVETAMVSVPSSWQS